MRVHKIRILWFRKQINYGDSPWIILLEIRTKRKNVCKWERAHDIVLCDWQESSLMCTNKWIIASFERKQTFWYKSWNQLIWPNYHTKIDKIIIQQRAFGCRKLENDEWNENGRKETIMRQNCKCLQWPFIKYYWIWWNYFQFPRSWSEIIN